MTEFCETRQFDAPGKQMFSHNLSWSPWLQYSMYFPLREVLEKLHSVNSLHCYEFHLIINRAP